MSNNIYNMDETGFIFGQGGSQQVLVPNGDWASCFKAQPANRESATVVECIGSGGQILPPLIITQGKVHTVGEQRQMVNIPATWRFSKGPTGYNNIQRAKLWVEQIFDPNTMPLQPEEYRLLVLNGHKIHTSSAFLDALWQRCIIPLCQPAHCTHVMQLLDVSVFGPLTAAYCRMVVELAPHLASTGVDKAQFGTCYARARSQTLTTASAKKVFQDLGMTIYPNPNKVLDRLPGSAAAGCQSGTAPLINQTNVEASQPTIPVVSCWISYRRRTTRGTLKHTLVQAYQSA